MGACCCCFPKRTEDPEAAEELEHVPLSSQHASPPAFSTRLLVDTNLDISIPDTYRPPPIPMPYDTPLRNRGADKNDTNIQITNSGPVQETVGFEDMKESNCKLKMKFSDGQETEEEDSDSCPICLEEYEKENPKLMTKCEHDFHLACILEWMERSNSCPVCDQRRRWGGLWRLHSWFGSMKNKKRIGHAVLLQDTSSHGAIMPSAEHPTHTQAITLPFIAPPSSPASFFLSEPPSSANSPTGFLSFNFANMYSPEGPASIFAIGPYAHETQLVSPPVFSTFTTEPSTAPFTPPPESVHLTTPSSPEVPFALLLNSIIKNSESTQQYPFPHHDFQSYQFPPGSPASHLISPSSGISGSGNSSPFPVSEFGTGLPHFGNFTTNNPPKLLTLDKFSTRVWRPRRASGSSTPDVCSKVVSNPNSVDGEEKAGIIINGGNQTDEVHVVHRVSFELDAEDSAAEKKP